MNREIYNKIREFSVDMYTQGYEDGYEDGKKDSCEIDKLKAHTSKPEHSTPINRCANCQNIPPINKCATCTHKGELKEYCSDCISYYKYEEMCCDNCALNLTECTDLDHFCDYKKWKPKQDESVSDHCLESKDTSDKDINTKGNYKSAQNEDECVDDEIRVGDEVIMYDNCSYKGVVISIPYGRMFNVLCEDSGVWIIYDKDDITKTGRHFPLITEMLNQLKEEIKQ